MVDTDWRNKCNQAHRWARKWRCHQWQIRIKIRTHYASLNAREGARWYHVTNCRSCHTEVDENTGEYIGKDFAGKAYFPPDDFSGGYSYVAPNLTPHQGSGIMAGWSEDYFVNRFRQGRVHQGSPMPWGAFSRMHEVELKALYRFFQSLEPVENNVEKIVYAPGEKPGNQ